MTGFITENETYLRLSVFAAVLVAMVLAEALFPKKNRTQARSHRWATNIGIVVIDSVVVRLVFPLVAVGTAAWAAKREIGLFHLVDLPPWLEIVAAVIILDMLIYWQHVATHIFPPLWALHKVHHVDRDIDVTTGVRFHPLEIVLSMLFKMACVLLLGPSIVAVIVFEIVLNACAMFNHANLRLPLGVDKALRVFIVTPDMHRVHHSVDPAETNSNYGFCLSIWDRLFGSYIPQPAKGHDNMVIGLPQHQTPDPSGLGWSLWLPFRRS